MHKRQNSQLCHGISPKLGKSLGGTHFTMMTKATYHIERHHKFVQCRNYRLQYFSMATNIVAVMVKFALIKSVTTWLHEYDIHSMLNGVHLEIFQHEKLKNPLCVSSPQTGPSLALPTKVSFNTGA